jgi:hypothetical protein
LLEHGDGVGGGGKEFWLSADELVEEDLRVGEGAAGGGVGGYGLSRSEGLVDVLVAVVFQPRFFQLDDELDGSDFVE